MNRRIIEAGQSPPWQRRGGRDIKNNGSKPPLPERTGWFVQRQINRWLERTTPSAPDKEASRHSYYRRSLPSFAKEGNGLLAGLSA
jgi:hypothetical protein